MAELSFCKAFLSALEQRPVKLPADHHFDPFEFEVKAPYTLPRLDEQRYTPLPKKRKTAPPPGAAKSVDIHLRSARNPPLHISLAKVDISNVSVADLKGAVEARVEGKDGAGARVPLDKIKILYNKKPAAGKMVTDVLGAEGAAALMRDGGVLKFGVMVLGGALALDKPRSGGSAAVTEDAAGAAPVVAADAGDVRHPSSEGADLETQDRETEAEAPPAPALDDAFWEDLNGFLRQRVDAAQAARMAELFKTAWLTQQ
ncbi:hypothetical protein KEM52_004145 [Ascosphaera acerosa]|nr:hypothetical protein KEM52_004145 [Ascosphaera acerosa]